VAGSVAVVADGNTVTGLRFADGRLLWHWAGPGWVAGLWPWRGLVAVLTGTNTQGVQVTGLDTATGAVAWTRRVPAGIYGLPVATADGGLAMAGNTGRLEVVGLGTGTLWWARRTGLAGPLAAADGLVLAVTGARIQRLAGYEDRSGLPKGTFGPLPGGPALTVVTGRVALTWLLSPRGTTTLAAIDAATGLLHWQFDMRRSVSPDAALLAARDAHGDPAVLATTSLPGRLWLISLHGGRLRWSAPAPLVPGMAPLVAGADVVTFQAPGANTVTGSAPSTAGLLLVSRDAATGTVRWARRIPQSTTGPAIQAGEDIVVRSDQSPAGVLNRLLAYRAASGQPAWRVNLPAPAWTPPIPAAGGLLAQAGYDTPFCAMPP
jgi:outer membrane protein assembly factor BamB